MGTDQGTAPNARRLLWAGFFAIFASGVGFGVRGAILVDWARAYGFTQAELGEISGGGLTGFGFVIILGSLIADRIGYGRLMYTALFLHVVSAALQMATDPIYASFGQKGVYWSLYVAMFLFSIGNGLCEVVVNPMTATLFPNNKTHYLNILHAGWPGGLVAGGLIGYFGSEYKVPWLIQMSMFLVPVAIYGAMIWGQEMPRSEAAEAGVGFGTMLAEFAAPVLLLLLLIHAMVGYVELGTDSWIQKITGSIMANAQRGMLLFVYTSLLMFTLRFFAGPIEHRLSPLGLLLSCAVIAALGLTLLSMADGVQACVMAVTVYAVGKTFFWPTMLAVVSERFPRGGAVTMGAVGGIGMLSAGFLGSPIIGFQQDYFAAQKLQQESPEVFARYSKDQDLYGLVHTKGLDGSKLSLLELTDKATDKPGKAADAADKEELDKRLKQLKESQPGLYQWYESTKSDMAKDAELVGAAGLFGGRQALQWTAIVPSMMALLYLALLVYFKMTGGYRRLAVAEEPAH